MMNNHFVYTHTSPSGKVYVGQTANIKRRWGYNGIHYVAKNKNGSFVHLPFARALTKYGWDAFEHKILLENVSKSEADYAEKYLIRWYKMHNISYNITDGGEGTLGVSHPMSEERRKAVSIFMQTKHPFKGKHHTEESRKKMSETLTGRKLSEEHIANISKSLKGKLLSKEQKVHRSEYMKQHPEQWAKGKERKEVHQYDLCGNYIQSFSSALEAALAISGKKNAGCIRSCIYGEVNTALGYFWSYDKKDLIEVPKPCNKRTNCPKRVNQYLLDGTYIKSFSSIAEASKATGITDRCIARCCRPEYRLKRAGTFLWEYDCGNNRKNKMFVQETG